MTLVTLQTLQAQLPVSARLAGLGLILLGLISCDRHAPQADHEAAPAAKMFERDRDMDGIIDLRVRIISRGKQAIMREVASRKDNAWRVFRIYYVTGMSVLTEIDENGDGMFELVVIERDSAMEAYIRKGDTVEAANASFVRQIKADREYYEDVWERTLRDDVKRR